jgi:hypothetical protein
MLTIQEAIRKVVKKFEDENGFINLTRASKDNFDLSFNLEDEIEFLLSGLNLEHKIELFVVYQDFDKSHYALCVSYIRDGILETYNVPVIS